MSDVDTKALLAEMIRKQGEANPEKAVEAAFSLYMFDRLDTHVQAITSLLAASAASREAATRSRIELERENAGLEARRVAILEKEAEESRLASREARFELAAKAQRTTEKDELELVLLRHRVDEMNSIAAGEKNNNGASHRQY